MASASGIEYREKYIFLTEWHNPVAEVVKEFLLSFFPLDESMELYDIRYRRMFLRRTQVAGIHLKSLFKGATVTIFSRQIKIVDYANNATAQLFSVALQKIFTLVKPDGVAKTGDIITYLEKYDFKISRLKMGRMTKDGVIEMFRKCSNTPPLDHDFVSAMTHGPCIAIEAIGEHGLQRWLNAVGPEDPVVAQSEAPNSLRAIHGHDLICNALYTSSEPHDVGRDADIWFPESWEKLYIEPTSVFVNTTCCVIKPHALQEGLVGNIINFIKDNGFRITAMELFYLDQAAAEDFYEVYKGLVPEYSSMVTQLASGPCIALEIIDDGEPSATAVKFRQLAGPIDPISAKTIRPDSLRAKFGTSTVLNAVHCTDLPEDASLEVDYFFKILQP